MQTYHLTRLFVAVAVAEAVSWTGLLAGMYFKYFTDAGELGVKIFGPLHGGIFVLYVALALVVARALRWSLGTTFVALVCAIPPFATLAFEQWVVRTGRLPLTERSPA